jgi:hypothetical protein
MPLVKATLQADLYSAFNAMNDIKDNSGNKYMAEKVAKAISDFVKTGQVTSNDAGTASDTGVYAGAGTGSMEIVESTLKSKLETTFESKYENNNLATHIASDIDDVCSASNTCSTTTTGTSTIPGTSPHPASGSGKGTFTGAKATIETKLKSCFSSMNSMVTGGNMYFAQEFAVAVYNYLKNGTIAITLQAPMSGAGSGGIQ